MNNIDLSLIKLTITRSGYPFQVSDTDNLKYRIVRAAHSLRKTEGEFSTYHWRDNRKVPLVVTYHIPAGLLADIPRDEPPCIRTQQLENAYYNRDSNRPIHIDAYIKAQTHITMYERLATPDPLTLHDYIDDAEECLNDTAEAVERAALTEQNTHRNAIGTDYSYAFQAFSAFKSYLPMKTALKIECLLMDVKLRLNSKCISDPAFRAATPSISSEVKTAISDVLTEEHLKEILAKHANKPVINKAVNRNSRYEMMYAILAEMTTKTKRVSFHKDVDEKQLKPFKIKLTNIRTILRFCGPFIKESGRKTFEANPVLQDAYTVKLGDEEMIERLFASLGTCKSLIKFFQDLFVRQQKQAPQLVNKILLIQTAYKERKFIDAFILTIDLDSTLAKTP